MIKQKYPSNQQSLPFQPLACNSPQIKPSSSLRQPEDINLEDEKEIQQMEEKRNRRKKHKAKKTNLIKVKPVQNQEQTNQHEIQYLPQAKVSQKQEEAQKEVQSPQKKELNESKKEQALQSPVLYRISDQQELEQREQDIPQSSRRPLTSSKKKLAPNISVDKKSLEPIFRLEKRSDSDEPQSPVKLINKKRKSSPKEQSNSHARRFIKMKKQVEQIEKRQPTQVYQYQEDVSSEQEYEEGLDEGSSESYDQQQENDERNDDKDLQQNQQKHEKQLPKPNHPKTQITVFKSNSFYTLINAQIPKNNFVNCLIRRKRTQDYFQKTITYQLYLLQDKKYLMTCTKNRLFKTTSHFQFYRQKPNAIKYHKENLYAYMDSNFTGTEFVLKTIHRNDTNSERSTAIDKSELLKMEESTSVISDQVHKGPMFYPNQPKTGNSDTLKAFDEKEVLFISFKANFFGFAGQRQVKMLKKKNKKLKPTNNFSNLRTAQQNGQIDKYTQINSKKAIQGKNGLQLDFKGIAQMHSSKNIILEAEVGKEVLIFGKVKQDIYAVAIGSPLSIVEGLAFGIANLDRKFFVN